MYVEARDAVWDFVIRLRVPHYFWLGLRGFIGALLWLVIPTALLSVGTAQNNGGAILVGYIGAFMV